MNEFKYACPVCGQHMMCDSTQAGTIMECPTCFQKIVAPQAPAPDAKFIITGTKYSEKKIPDTLLRAANAGGPIKKAGPIAAILLVSLLVVSGAVIAIFHKQLFKGPAPASISTETGSDQTSANPSPAPPPPPPKKEKPAPVAPPANDTNWMLALDTAAIPDAPVAGRIHGQDFIMERANFSNGNLTIRAGTRGPVEFGIQISFPGAQAESLSGQTINITTNADKAAKITLRWKDTDGTVQKDNYDAGYALRLEFGTLANNRLPGKIYLCAPDDTKSYLMGTFTADARKPKPKAPKPPQ